MQSEVGDGGRLMQQDKSFNANVANAIALACCALNNTCK